MRGFRDIVQSRSSCRSFSDEPLEEGALIRMLEAANAAPSAHNTQPWYFCVVMSREAKGKLFADAGEAYYGDLLRQGTPAAEARDRARKSERFFTGVPALVVVFAEQTPDQGDAIERTLRLQSASAASAQLLLAAENEGIGACWYCLPLYCPEVFRKFAGLSESFEPTALIVLGYSLSEKTHRQKRALSEKMNIF